MDTRGLRNKNPFNIRYSNNSWLGKKKKGKKDKEFEEFYSLDYGVRAGVQLLRGYLIRGYDTVETIINRFSPPSENKTSSYISYVYSESPALKPGEKISLNSLNFYWLCKAICMYESAYYLDYDYYLQVCKRFRII